jgi:hypothetical protein
MTGHRLEVADVFRAFQEQFFQRWGLCRTAALRTYLERCDRCSYETLAYDSCRNRHCPMHLRGVCPRLAAKPGANVNSEPTSALYSAIFLRPAKIMPCLWFPWYKRFNEQMFAVLNRNGFFCFRIRLPLPQALPIESLCGFSIIKQNAGQASSRQLIPI